MVKICQETDLIFAFCKETAQQLIMLPLSVKQHKLLHKNRKVSKQSRFAKELTSFSRFFLCMAALASSSLASMSVIEAWYCSRP